MVLELLIFFLGKVWDWLFPKRNDNLKMITLYGRRIQKLEEDKEELTKKHESKETENRKIIDSIKARGFSTRRIIENYGKPLNAIFISYASQYEKTERGSNISSSFIKNELEKYNSKYLGGTDALIPPKNVPPDVKDKKSLQEWFESKILKGRYCKLKILSFG